MIERDGEILTTTDDDYGPDIFVDYLLNFIEKNKDNKFLAYYPMALVHDPFLPTPDSKSWEADVPGRHRSDTINFRDMVTYTDKMVGKITGRLKELGLFENTVIIFTADNGTGQRIVTPMRDGSRVAGGKGLTISRGHHVPLIVNWGTGRYKNHLTDDLIDFTDVLPTISDLVGKPVPTAWNTDGLSFYPQIANKKGKTREWIFSHYSPLHNAARNKDAARFFRNHRYKLYQDGRFYDLKADPEEKTPIAKNEAGKSGEKIRKVFEKQFATLPAWKLGDPGVKKEVIRGLEPLESFYR